VLPLRGATCFHAGVSRFRSTILVVAATFVGACRPVDTAPRFLQPTLILPKNPDGVFLNEDLVFFFDDEVDRASVTRESVRIVARDGTAARGTLSVEGTALRFSPVPVLAPDLSDGGYRPGTEYDVEIRGFPAVDGLRSTSGAPLAHPLAYRFRTVSIDVPTPPKDGGASSGGGASSSSSVVAFVDPLPDRTAPLNFFPPPSDGWSLPQIGALDSIYLDSDKPIDPASVRDGDFTLVSAEDGARERVAVRARLIENEPKARPRKKPGRVVSVAPEAAWAREPRAALLELSPVTRLAPGRWWLTLEDKHSGPRDFSGHALWRVNALTLPRFVVGFRGPDAGQGVMLEEFLDRRLASPVEVPGTDGTVFWGETGRAEVRFPAAAGDGAAGRLTMSGSVLDTDVRAQTLEIPHGATATLSNAPGLVVLRSQGRLTVRGRLERAVDLAPEAIRAQAIDLSARKDAPRRATNLSTWLARVAAQGASVTVLVAGGDLVVDADAEVRVNTPLVLVAGGVVRINGAVRGPQDSSRSTVFVLGDGGGDIDPPAAWADALAIDPVVEGNPLREELHYAILSGPIPPRGLAANWLWFEARGSPRSSSETRGASRWSVRFVREFEGAPTRIEDLGPVDDPRLLDGASTLRMLIEMWIAPGDRLEVPFVDDVQMRWDPKPARSGERSSDGGGR